MRILLPWLDPRLSPNKRRDLRALTAARRDAIQYAWAVTFDQHMRLDPAPLKIKILFCPPDRRRRDLDNLYSTFKPYQDGIFLALELDDSLIERAELWRGETTKGGAVIVEISEAEK